METTRTFLFYLRPTEWLSPGGLQFNRILIRRLALILIIHADQQGNQSIFIFSNGPPLLYRFFQVIRSPTGGGDDGRFAEFHPMPMKRINQLVGPPIRFRDAFFLRSYTNLPVLSICLGPSIVAPSWLWMSTTAKQ